uniref:Receptor-like serine/threonine-protein kinase n=1 Tax=Leersia perrieri TaxID=77586 RepID=A0A0D9WXV1_9ORYZ
MDQLFLTLLSTSILLLTSSAAAESTLTASATLGGNQTLVSPGDIFRLGLFPAVNRTRWFLGIWFTVSPDAVVWVANRDRPLLTQSAAVIAVNGSRGGGLVLLDATASNAVVWSSSSAAATAAQQAQLLDTGNLVVRDKEGNVVWQSFEHPTNTFLPGIRVGKDLRTGADWSLSSWRAADDPSPGDYRYVMDTSGAPELHVWSRGRRTYRTGPWNGVRFSGIPEMTTFEDMFEFQFTGADGASGAGEVSYQFRNRDGSPMSRVLLNESGVMQRMVWDRSAASWSNFWSGPRDQCDTYGRCGAFGVCNVVDATVCGCIRGFAPKSPEEWYMRNTSGGCGRKTPLQCGGDGFYLLRGVKLPETHGCAVDAGATLEECRRRCLSDCNCTAYSGADIRGAGSGCIQWFGELMDTRFVDGGQDLYVRLAESDLDAIKNTKKFVVVIALVITGFVLLLLSLGFLIWMKARRGKKVRVLDETGDFIAECPTYPFEIIRAATNGFSEGNKIGEGGFGFVYKGRLPDGQEVAVKKLSKENTVQGLKEFKNEVDLIAKLQHRNLVRLLGFCIHCTERLLVYEYMSNKSLDTFIFNKNEGRRATLGWKTRMNIILGVARGLLYLHEDSRHTIIHRDLKAANVLLDGDMVAKISDFGIARRFSSSGADQKDCTITDRVVGTLGYMSPEYAMDGKLSFMQDVYSFGVLLLEIISGKRNQGTSNLIAHTWRLWEEGRNTDLLEPAIRGECTGGELEQATTCIQVGLLCVQESPDQRPPMADVIHMLSREKALGQPRRPVMSTVATTYGHSGRLTITDLEAR